MIHKLFMYEGEVRAAIERLHGIALPQRTLAHWRANGIVRSSLRFQGDDVRHGFAARGAGRNRAKYTIADFQRVRLVAVFRYVLQLSLTEIGHVLREHGPRLTAILTGKSDGVLMFNPVTRKVVIKEPGSLDFDVRANQFLLDLEPLREGNEAAAREARASA
jgi:hypothetical protein